MENGKVNENVLAEIGGAAFGFVGTLVSGAVHGLASILPVYKKCSKCGHCFEAHSPIDSCPRCGSLPA